MDRFTEMNRFATSDLVTNRSAGKTAAVLLSAAGEFWWLVGAHGVVLTAAILAVIGVL